MKITKSCSNCAHTNSLCRNHCVNFSSHEYDCDYCAEKLKDQSKFCNMDHGDDGFSCCGDKFELHSNYTEE